MANQFLCYLVIAVVCMAFHTVLSISSITPLDPKADDDIVLKGNCTCGAFDMAKGVPGKDNEPIVQHSHLVIPCNESSKCKGLCEAMAQVDPDRAKKFFCQAVKHIEEVNIGVFAKTCDDGIWEDTQVRSDKSFCCHQGLESSCPSEPSTA